MATIDLDQILSTAKDKRLPPVSQWSPELSGDIDIRIDSAGDWWHEGSKIEREGLSQLFSTILRCENDQYFLLTPVEKWRIQVDDLAFVVVAMDSKAEHSDQQEINLITSTGDIIALNADVKIDLANTNIEGEPRPEVLVRDELWARISRKVFYQLIDLGEEEIDADGNTALFVRSYGQKFLIGHY